MGHMPHAEGYVEPGGEIAYVNTGTWTHVFQRGRHKASAHHMYYVRVLRDRAGAPLTQAFQQAELLR